MWHTGTRDRVQPHYKQSRAKSASRIIWDLSSSLQTREHPLFPRQRSVIPEPKSHAALILIRRLVQSLVLYSLCVSVYLSAVECTSFISSPLKSGLSFLCWAQVSLYTYMSSFLQIISLHKEVVHSKCCRGLGWWALSAWLNLWLPSKST